MFIAKVTALVVLCLIIQQSEAGKSCSFTAVHPQAILYLLPGTRLRFSSELHDSCDAFDTSRYEYVCPKRGVYFFSYCLYSGILKYSGSYYRSGAQLFINDKAIIDTLSFNGDPNYHMVVSTCQIIVYKCSKGHKVHLETRFAPNYIGNFYRTTFTGFKLQ